MLPGGCADRLVSSEVSVARRLRLTVAALAALVITPWPAARAVGPQTAADTLGRSPGRLFDTAEPIAFTLTSDLGAVAKDRGTQKRVHHAVLSYVGPAGDSTSFDVQLRTRGHWRLRTCEFPPLKVEFDRETAKPALFAHQKSLKLVVQCRSPRAYANYLLEEYLIYRIYNLLTECSFRVRLARVTYVDAAGKRTPATRYAFFIEDDDRMAKRCHGHVLEQQGISQADAGFSQMGLLTVFEYLIGNTDWSVAALHNIVLVQDSMGELYPVPYDFDWSGVISTPYAFPDARLGIRTVRDRLYRGACRTPADFAPLFVRFNAVKDSVYALYRGQPDLEPKRVAQALGYYDEFYRIINDPRWVNRELIHNCLPG